MCTSFRKRESNEGFRYMNRIEPSRTDIFLCNNNMEQHKMHADMRVIHVLYSILNHIVPHTHFIVVSNSKTKSNALRYGAEGFFPFQKTIITQYILCVSNLVSISYHFLYLHFQTAYRTVFRSNAENGEWQFQNECYDDKKERRKS